MNIFIASDHAGFELKDFLIESLSHVGHTVIDCGAYAQHDGDDYPPFIAKAARAVSEAEAVYIAQHEDSFNLSADPHSDNLDTLAQKNETRAIVIGGSGTGEAIVANKYPHVRCAICYGGDSAFEIIRLSREHNNSNVLSLGARFLAHDQALELVLEWLNIPFSGDERHVRRIHEIDIIEHNKNETLYE
ncbi:MAG: RpiB/LacA/LacB family sugar-phosphate isomerase [Candidatus Pacebacteria bacterium]|nr:RpiB/LacA/LacB family sugar-phosphate isomerase [Candidatus Paceibacterota bacterium]